MIDGLTYTLLVYGAYAFFAARRIMTYLHIYQQEEYDSSRFLRWIAANNAFDKILSGAIVLVFVLWLAVPSLASQVLLFTSFAAIAWMEKDPRRDSKKKLVMTARARRIFLIAFAIALLMGTWWFIAPVPLLWLAPIQMIPFFIMLANEILRPFENAVQKKFWNEAHTKLQTIKPTVIGITGSYGKTSVKHILGHILKTSAPTLVTPGSVNTPMGITRIIREQMEDNCKYFVVEMGAYGPGSIARLCRLAPPDMAVITAIGHAHYERFRSLDTVAQAKFELAEAVIAKKGLIVVQDKVLENPYALNFKQQHAANFIVCGTVGDLHIHSMDQTEQGLDVEITWQQQPYRLQVPLFGLHHALNAAIAFATAAALGIAPEHIIAALHSVPQITHRLEVKRQGDGTTLIDDAFNSNPEGFRAALDLLGTLQGSRKILVTPGMVELGEAHTEAHDKAGARAGEVCDVAVVVQGRRIPSFLGGFRRTGETKKLVEVESFAQASAWLDRNRASGDIILLENDLPDIYEQRLKI